jgi:hypothetical protein
MNWFGAHIPHKRYDDAASGATIAIPRATMSELKDDEGFDAVPIPKSMRCTQARRLQLRNACGRIAA